jgi:hypothetical protein
MNRFGFAAERSGAANPKSRSIRLLDFLCRLRSSVEPVEVPLQVGVFDASGCFFGGNSVSVSSFLVSGSVVGQRRTSMRIGNVERAQSVQILLRDGQTAFGVVYGLPHLTGFPADV